MRQRKWRWHLDLANKLSSGRCRHQKLKNYQIPKQIFPFILSGIPRSPYESHWRIIHLLMVSKNDRKNDFRAINSFAFSFTVCIHSLCEQHETVPLIAFLCTQPKCFGCVKFVSASFFFFFLMKLTCLGITMWNRPVNSLRYHVNLWDGIWDNCGH